MSDVSFDGSAPLLPRKNQWPRAMPARMTAIGSSLSNNKAVPDGCIHARARSRISCCVLQYNCAIQWWVP